jgi:transposase InsO family protein
MITQIFFGPLNQGEKSSSLKIKSVIAELERQTGLQVKAIRSDRRGEYINQTLQDYLKKKGIVQQLTTPYSPEQNGKAERLNRRLVERV